MMMSDLENNNDDLSCTIMSILLDMFNSFTHWWLVVASDIIHDVVWLWVGRIHRPIPVHGRQYQTLV